MPQFWEHNSKSSNSHSSSGEKDRSNGIYRGGRTLPFESLLKLPQAAKLLCILQRATEADNGPIKMVSYFVDIKKNK